MSKRTIEYDRSSAVNYAHKWAYSRNPAFYNYELIGGDCTNFSSQCIFAGSNVMNFASPLGWFYINANNKSPSWSGVQYLRNFLVNNKDGVGPSAKEVSINDIVPGDLIQISFDGKVFQHSLFVVSAGPVPTTNNILIATHTDDADYRPLNTYNYSKIRYLHILFVRI